MANGGLLSGLCTIWSALLLPPRTPHFDIPYITAKTPPQLTAPQSYTQEPKYRCPRCTTRTCSLACYQKHQQRASCSGQRDPTRFQKKSQLATPAGIDHDYNYLKSVERRIEIGERDTAIDPTPSNPRQDSAASSASSASAPRTAARARDPQGRLQRYLHENRITVQYAPQGMSRQRSNLTRCSNRGKILWTVEWVAVSSTSTSYVSPSSLETKTALPVLQHECLAENSTAASYELLLAERRNAEMRKGGMVKDEPREQGTKSVQQETITNFGHPADSTKSTADFNSTTGTIQSDREEHHPKPQPSSAPSLSTAKQKQTHIFYLQHFHNTTPISTIPPKPEIYLKPLYAGTKTWTQALQNHSIREFPTIYVVTTTTTTTQPLPRKTSSSEDALHSRSGEKIAEMKAAGEAEGEGEAEAEAEARKSLPPNVVICSEQCATHSKRPSNHTQESKDKSVPRGKRTRRDEEGHGRVNADVEQVEAETVSGAAVDANAILEMLRRDLGGR